MMTMSEILAVVKVECMMQDGGGLNATTSLTISLLSSAGYPPVFLGAHYNATVYENAPLVRDS